MRVNTFNCRMVLFYLLTKIRCRSVVFVRVHDLFSVTLELCRSYKRLRTCMAFCKRNGYNATLVKAISNSFKYGMSLYDYYQFRLYERNSKEGVYWLSNRLRMFIDMSMNDIKYINVSRDKYESYKLLKEFFKRNMQELSSQQDVDRILDQNWGTAIVCKPRFGTWGHLNKFMDTSLSSKMLRANLIEMVKNGPWVVESYIQQHPLMKQLHPLSVNTLRAHTIFHNGKVHFLGAVLRIGVGKKVDNLYAGGIAAPIDDATGIVSGPAVSGNPFQTNTYDKHPITGEPIVGMQIPYWSEILQMVEQMGSKISELKSIGWDIAITEEGPVLVEMNVHWSVEPFQLPFQKGRLNKLLPFINQSVLYPAHRKYLSGINI